MASSIFVHLESVSTYSVGIRLGNNTNVARTLTLRVIKVNGTVVVYQNNYYLPPHQVTLVGVNNLESSTQYKVIGSYNTEETTVNFITATPFRTIAGRVNVIKDNLAEIQGRVFVSNQTLAEISGKVTVRVATPEKLPEDWEYSSTPEPEDWDEVNKDATSWGEGDKPVDDWSENEKDNVNWSSGKKGKPQKWHYPLKDT